ncbi:MAG TPA: hypothetical protein VHU41_12805 [Thermoanaerobaculia bacterium]|jgi:hypothetical protein|nr:hypothetical protein [Thermoanaerobaculia bacterium]
MNQNHVTQSPSAADTPQQTPAVTPEGIVQQLRAVSAQIPEVTPLNAQQREVLRRQAQTSKNGEIVETSISMIGAADLVSQAVGQSPDDVYALVAESGRWAQVEDELRAMLNGIVGANLIRRQKIAVIAERAFGVGSQLARDPEHAVLVPHVEEIKRLKKIARRKKPAPAPQPQAPNTSATPKA